MNTTQTSKGELLAGIQVTLVKADYEALKQMQSIQQTTISNRIDGDKVDSNEVVKVSKKYKDTIEEFMGA